MTPTARSAQLGVGGGNLDPRRRAAVHGLREHRGKGDQHGEGREHDRGRVKQPAVDPLGVFTPGDDERVRQERIDAAHWRRPLYRVSRAIMPPAPRRRPGRGSSRRPRSPDVVDEDLLERRICDLEVGTRAPAPSPRRGRVRLDPGVQLDLGAFDARPDHPGAGHARKPGEPVVALHREQHHPLAHRPLDVAQRSADDRPAAIDDRHRLAHRLDGIHLVGREDDRLAAVAELEDRLPQQRRC